MSITDTLRTASVEDLVNAIIALEGERPGFAYDVGQSLIDHRVQKEFPGPLYRGFDLDPEYRVQVTGFDPARRMDALKGFRSLWSLSVRDAQQPLQSLTNGQVLADIDETWQSGGHGLPYGMAQERVAAFAAYGITAVIQGPPHVPQTHTRTLGDCLAAVAVAGTVYAAGA